MFHIRYYESQRGERPVAEFIESMDKQTRAKTSHFIGLLQQFGPHLKRPYADKLQGKIYELRPKQSRILYFFFAGNEIIFVHGFVKKTNEVDRRNLFMAERRRRDWLARHREEI